MLRENIPGNRNEKKWRLENVRCLWWLAAQVCDMYFANCKGNMQTLVAITKTLVISIGVCQFAFLTHAVFSLDGRRNPKSLKQLEHTLDTRIGWQSGPLPFLFLYVEIPNCLIVMVQSSLPQQPRLIFPLSRHASQKYPFPLRFESHQTCCYKWSRKITGDAAK